MATLVAKASSCGCAADTGRLKNSFEPTWQWTIDFVGSEFDWVTSARLLQYTSLKVGSATIGAGYLILLIHDQSARVARAPKGYSHESIYTTERSKAIVLR